MANVKFTLGTLNAYEHVPAVTRKLPVLVMLPGKGEVGTDATKLLINGPSKFIQGGWDPQNFIIVSVQPTAEWANPAYVDAILTNIVARYKDKSDGRLFLTGLSAGGYAIDNYLGQNTTAVNRTKVTAAVVMSAPTPETYFDKALYTQPAWGFCGTQDSWYVKMKALLESMSKKFTSYPDGHKGWNQFYDPAWKENGVSIYEWLDSINPPVVQPPVVIAKEVIITPGTDGGVYKSATTLGINPGDTVVLQGDYYYFNLKDLNGTAEKPITVLAQGLVTVGGYKAYAMIFENSSYFNVIPLNSRGGIIINGKIEGYDSTGLAFNKCHHFTVKGLEITNVSVGIMAKTTPKSETPGTYESETDTFAYDTVTIEGNYIHDITGEGTYIGCSTSTLMPITISGAASQVYAYRVKNLKVINNRIENTGWDGIQVTCGDNVLIDNNEITNYGTKKIGYQEFGIICAANKATITNNQIKNGEGTGITGSFNGVCEIAYNTVISAYGEGQDAIYANAHAIKDYEKFKPNIHDNYIENCQRNAIRVANTDGFEVPGIIKDNKYKNSLGIVDASGSELINNIDVSVVPPVDPPVTPYPVAIIWSDGTQWPITKP